MNDPFGETIHTDQLDGTDSVPTSRDSPYDASRSDMPPDFAPQFGMGDGASSGGLGDSCRCFMGVCEES